MTTSRLNHTKTFCVALWLLTACDTSPPITSSAYNAIIVQDGDSLKIGQHHIRLFGIDAPELHQTCIKKGQPWRCGEVAKTTLSNHIGNSPLTCRHHDRDRYGRVVAECYVAGKNLNAWMVRSGWALAYRRYSDQFIREEQAAQAESLGLWQSTFTKPWDWRRQNPRR